MLLKSIGWTAWGSNPGRGMRFFSSPKCPDQLWRPPSFLLNGEWGSFPGVKWSRHETDHSPPSSG